MIYKIEYTRRLSMADDGIKLLHKTSTFITKETDERKILLRWLKNHSLEFIKNVLVNSIGPKYPK